MSYDEFLKAMSDDIAPEKLGGESWFATEEYPTDRGIDNPYTRGETGREGFYYPGRKKRGEKFTP